MLYSDEEFGVCPAGKEADLFHKRILEGLIDAFSELIDRYGEISAIDPKERDQDEAEFLALYDKVQNDLKRLKEPELAYDKKYELAQQIRECLNNMEIL
jgi:hypothetical protein